MSQKSCKVDGCAKPHHAKGYCDVHHMRVKKYGDPHFVKKRETPLADWIEAHKDYAGDDCLDWPFGKGDHGRGVMGRKRISAPRAMCIAAYGPPPDESMEAAHSCGNGHLGCTNPKHLRWATQLENMRDRDDHGRTIRGHKVNTAKLSEDDVRDIRGRAKIQSQLSLAREYGVSPTNVSDIVKRKSWKHVE